MSKPKASLDDFAPAPSTVRLPENDRPSRRSPPAADAAPADPSGEPLKLKSFRLPVSTAKRLALLKAQTGRTEQDLAEEAFSLLFSKLS